MKELWIRNLRVFALFAVVTTHVAAPLLYETDSSIDFNWWIGNVIIGSVRFCVPIFLMITGALLLTKRDTIQSFLKKRLTRVVIPFVFWTLIYLIYDIFRQQLTFDSICIYIANNIKTFLLFGIRGHFWYVYMIIGLYLIIPILQRFMTNKNKKEITYYLLIWIITLFINLFVKSSGEYGYSYNKGVDLTYFSNYLGYIILGYYLSNYNIIQTKKASLLILLGFSITVIGSYLLTKQNDQFTGTFVRYLTPNILIISAGVFILFKNNFNCSFKSKILSNIIKLIDRYSYGIYLSHIFVLSIISYFNIDRHFVTPLIGVILTTFLCTIISLLITVIVSKLPYGKYISG